MPPDTAPDRAAAVNPLLQPWGAPFGLPPFEAVRPGHFEPAFSAALAAHREEIARIGADAQPPAFDSTVAAFDASGRLLARVAPLFALLTASNTSPALQEAERALAPRLAAHRSAVYLDEALFARIDALHARRDELGLGAEQKRLLERVHLDFVLAGARLRGAARTRMAAITQRLAELQTRFAQNVLHDEAQRCLWLTREDDLAGLPQELRAAARSAAEQRGRADAWALPLARAMVVPFLAHSTRRDLREQAFTAWKARGAHPGAHDNRPLIGEILALRQEQARLHGYPDYASFALVDRMAGTPAAALDLLQRVWEPAVARAARERAELEDLARAQGHRGRIEPWDWRFFSEQLRRQRYAVDDAEVRPYFALDRMLAAAFDVAGRLFGLELVARPDLPVYHPDVRAFEVRRAGRPIGVFLSDNYARPNKRSGAWMSSLRQQSRIGGAPVLPVIVNNNNFAPAPAGRPTLLSPDDVRTLFHEFGHALHGLLSDVTYERLAGTSVLRDFVELPSQLFEHWAFERSVLRAHARHADSGAPIPEALIDRLEAARQFNQGYETVGYTACALLDLALHAHPEPAALDIERFERDELARLGLPAGCAPYHRLPHFQHLFAGSAYAAGYYVYLWAEVLDADGFDAFVEAGDPFDRALAQRLLAHIYAAGGSVDPRAAYRAFRGRDPVVEPLLAKRGLLPA